MSTTVTYKGNTLTTVNNATKTLKTAGKYMEGDVVLADTTVDLSSDTVTPATLMQGYTAHDASGAAIVGTATGGSIIIRDEADSHGGTIRHITGGSIVQGTKVITENGTYDVAAYADVNVSVPTGGNAYQDENGYVVLREGESTAPQGTLSITANGTYDVTQYAGTTVNVVKTYTATISGNGDQSLCFAQVNATGTKYYTDGDTFMFKDGDDVYVEYRGIANGTTVTVNGELIKKDPTSNGKWNYTVENPQCDMTIEFTYADSSASNINFIVPAESIASITSVGMQSVGKAFANVDVGGMSETDLKGYIERTSVFTDIEWPEGITRIGQYAFAQCVTFNPSSLPSSITIIQSYAFYGCSSLSLTSLPSGITSIGSYAFYLCNNLALTSLPSGITAIPEYCFYYCYRLALTSLPSGITSIGSNAFRACSDLALTGLPSGITSIGESAFNGCYNLALTSLPSGITEIPRYAFYQCTHLTLTELPSTITKIDSFAFQFCTGLVLISCEGTITILGSSAFLGNANNPMSLTSVSFPNLAITSNLGTVFGSTTAANACQLLEFCDIGKATGIGANAFANCLALDTLVIRKTTLCTLSNVSAFTNTPMSGYNNLTGKVYVPSALISTYQTATNWSTLYNNGTIEFLAIEGSDYER